jgi:hypothetical protein
LKLKTIYYIIASPSYKEINPMKMNVNKVVRLNDYENVKELNEENETFKCNGMAILIGKDSSLNMSKDLLLYSNFMIRNVVKGLKVKQDLGDGTIVGSIEDKSRDFMIQYSLMNESLFNSYSFSQKDFLKLEDFDKISIKENLLRLAAML